MKMRCFNKGHIAYKDYGGRGITVCERWLKFENFLADMGERPDGLTLDRKDCNKNYAADNCRWATPAEQIHNRRDYTPTPLRHQARWLIEMGYRRAEVARMTGINYSTLRWIEKEIT
jgi:hypothetical protein